MNDTDGLAGGGIFPVTRSGAVSSLAIEHASVYVELGREELRERRRYVISNQGAAAGRFEMGWICTGNALDGYEPCKRMEVDGEVATLSFHTSLVRDPEFFDSQKSRPRVEIMERSRKEIDEAMEHNDGTIVVQSWASASLEFAHGQRRTVEIERRLPLNCMQPTANWLPDLRLSTERFFQRASIPTVEFRFEVEGGSLEREFFTLPPALLHRVQMTNVAGAMVWVGNDYPVQEGGEWYYGRAPFEPRDGWAALSEHIRSAWVRARGGDLRCGSGSG